MRWLFADPHNPDEAAQVREKLAAIDRWWQAFQAKASDFEALFKRRTEWDLPRFMEDTLQAIDERLMWEFGPAVRQGGQRLVITPESHRFLRPLVRTVLELAPKVAGWEFYAYRLAEAAEETISMVKSRVDVDVTGALVQATVAPGRKVDLQYAFPNLPELDEQTAMIAAFAATETLMGEQVLDTWIGEIGLLNESSGGGPPAAGRALPLARAQVTVAALIRSLIDQLPARRRHELPDGAWSTLKLQPPEPADDYPARTDLIFANTADLELFRAMLSGQPFASSCHSRLGETFCYLTLDAQEVPWEERINFRATFEDALRPALVSAGLGAIVGGGSGHRYAYIDLALTELKRAAPVIRQVLRDQAATKRSWLLFCDDEYAHEWVGAYGDTPPPPAEPDSDQ
jgi:hypothetical protein